MHLSLCHCDNSNIPVINIVVNININIIVTSVTLHVKIHAITVYGYIDMIYIVIVSFN